MRTALFVSKNLIGDGLYISPAWQQWYKEHGQRFDRIDLFTLPDHVALLYKGMGVPKVNVITELDREQVHYDFCHEFNVNDAFAVSDRDKCHVAESYAKLLLVELEKKDDLSHLRPTYQPPVIELGENEKRLILVSMFSASCSSRQGDRPNKMLPWSKWQPIWRWLAENFPENPVRLLGAPTDEMPREELERLQAIHPDTQYMRGARLDRLAWIMRESLFTITVDNGMSHLAASQEAREFVLYPSCLGTHYILPVGNQKRMGYVHMDPMSVSPAWIVYKLDDTRRAKWEL